MGLDSYWELADGSPEPVFLPPLNLCAGLFSGNGQGSFRGKVYAELIESASGVSIHEEYLDNDSVCQIADGLDTAPWEEFRAAECVTQWDIGPNEFRDLRRMFRAYADAGAALRGWW